MQVCCTFLVVRRRLVFLMASFACWLVCFKERKKERKELRWEWRAWGLIVAWMVVEITLENISQVNILENISQFFLNIMDIVVCLCLRRNICMNGGQQINFLAFFNKLWCTLLGQCFISTVVCEMCRQIEVNWKPTHHVPLDQCQIVCTF